MDENKELSINVDETIEPVKNRIRELFEGLEKGDYEFLDLGFKFINGSDVKCSVCISINPDGEMYFRTISKDGTKTSRHMDVEYWCAIMEKIFSEDISVLLPKMKSGELFTEILEQAKEG